MEKGLLSSFLEDPSQSEESLNKLFESLSSEEFSLLQSLVCRVPYENLNKSLINSLDIKELVMPNQPSSGSGVSHFIPEESIKALISETRFPNEDESATYHKLMQEIFLSFGKIPNYERLMGHFPLYLQKHLEVINIFFDSDLSISAVWRYYIANMAVATHKCEYLMRLLEQKCRREHQNWFEDPLEVPEKLQILGAANAKLAHRPWEFTEKDVRALMTYWNSNELVLALTILCQFHCLSGFVFGLGVCAEPDLPLKTFKPISAIISSPKPKTSVVDILRTYSESKETENYFSDSSEDLHGDQEDIYFSRVAGGYLSYINYPMDYFSRTFNASDFRFADQAYYILEKLLPEVCESVSDKIRFTFAMTYEYIGQDTTVETGPIRRAMWNYVQRVYGLQYDDYNYTDINKFIKINTKKYIKKVACFPETVTLSDFINIELDLTHDEMVHLNLIISEARFEAQLVYMLHAVQRALDIV